MKNALLVFTIALAIVLLSTGKTHATVVKMPDVLLKYDCNVTSKKVMKRVVKKAIQKKKEERVVLITPVCPIVDNELVRKKQIGYGAERDLARDIIWNSVTRTPDVYTFPIMWTHMGGMFGVGGYNLVTSNVSNVIQETPQVSAVPIPNALVLFFSVVFLMLRRR